MVAKARTMFGTRWLWLALCAACLTLGGIVAPNHVSAQATVPAYIGTAEMSSDGTITLRLRAEGSMRGIGHSVQTYPARSPSIRRHPASRWPYAGGRNKACPALAGLRIACIRSPSAVIPHTPAHQIVAHPRRMRVNDLASWRESVRCSFDGCRHDDGGRRIGVRPGLGQHRHHLLNAWRQRQPALLGEGLRASDIGCPDIRTVCRQRAEMLASERRTRKRLFTSAERCALRTARACRLGRLPTWLW